MRLNALVAPWGPAPLRDCERIHSCSKTMIAQPLVHSSEIAMIKSYARITPSTKAGLDHREEVVGPGRCLLYFTREPPQRIHRRLPVPGLAV